MTRKERGASMIEVRIPAERLVRFGNDVHAGIHVLRTLRDAGVPAVGVLYVQGVERGVLEIEFDDLAMDEWVYRWKS